MKKFILFFVFSILLFVGCHTKPPVVDVPESSSVITKPSEPMPGEIKQQTHDGSTADLDEITSKFQPIFFDYNQSMIREDQVPAMKNNAALLRSHPNVNVILEGHCDERGTDEYNLALGERRSRIVKDYLANLGVDPNRLQMISYGESRPFANGHDEDSWGQNRRAQSVVFKQH